MSGLWHQYPFLKYPYKEFQDRKIKVLVQEKVILDMGGGKRFQKWLRQYERLFVGVEYKTFDFDESTSPDIVGDIHNIPLEDKSIDAVICYSVLEHVIDPVRAIAEIHRVLKDRGKLLLYVPSTYPYHAHRGHYPDYWRFFDDTVELLFEDWSNSEVQKVGGYFRALFFFLPLQQHMRWLLDPLSYALDTAFRTDQRSTTSGYIVYAEK